MTNDWATMDTGYCLVHTKLLLNYFAKVKSNKMKTNVTKSQSKSKQTNAIQNTPNLHENLNNMLIYETDMHITKIGKCGKILITNKIHKHILFLFCVHV